MFDQLFGQLFGQLVAIRSLSDELLALSQSNHFWISCSISIAWSINDSWLFTCVNCLAHWLLKLEAVQDKIYLQIDCALVSNHLLESRLTI